MPRLNSRSSVRLSLNFSSSFPRRGFGNIHLRAPRYSRLQCLMAVHTSTSGLRYHGTISSQSCTAQKHKSETSLVGETLSGLSGSQYFIEAILQEKGHIAERVYLASVNERKVVLKDVHRSKFKQAYDMQHDINASPYLRLFRDLVPAQSILVYDYLSDHLLNLVQEDLPLTLTKRILGDTLRGIAVLHDRNIFHADYEQINDEMVIKSVQLGDLEDAAYVPPGSHIVGFQIGNQFWRSPEAHAEGRVGKPSDMFSFGIVCIYAVLKTVIFAIDDKDMDEDTEPLSIILDRQLSYFAEQDTLQALLDYIGPENPWREIFEVIRGVFDKAHPREPFRLWLGLDPEFKDLVRKMTNFDPEKRITAHEVLEHSWFKDV